jgi:dUTP pyrophosphatase
MLQIKKIYKDSVEPTRAYPEDSGLDLYSYNYQEEDIVILPGTRRTVCTGIKIKLPRVPTFINNLLHPFGLKLVIEAQIRSKSGLAANQLLQVLNSPGTIDQPYIGELLVILYNHSDSEPIVIKHKQKIAQFVLCLAIIPTQEVVEEFDELTDRGENNLGSSGLGLGCK